MQAGLEWIDAYGNQDGDGFVDYKTRSPSGLRNQGWKDSFNGMVMEDGCLAEPPIALPEVQGYVYLAWKTIADLMEADGDHHAAARLRDKARKLAARFNREFWPPDERFYAFCRQADLRFSHSIASNAGHTLWTGIIPPARARAVAKRLLQPDMFSGWGIRTLSSDDVSYNPLDYQVGSIWPHDNAFIALGLYRYGLHKEGSAVFTALRDAAARFDHFRLPEVFAGFDRSYASRPVQYPVACNPQAWAAGSIPLLVQSALGIQPDGLHHCLRIHNPCLPDWLDWVHVRNLRIAGASLDLHYERSENCTYVAVTRSQGDVAVLIQP